MSTRGPGGSWPRLAAVALGGAVGSVARAGVDVAVIDVGGVDSWPLATLVVNLMGAFVLGVLVVRLGPSTWADGVRVGVLGAFTTFSALVVEVVGLGERPLVMAAYLVTSLAGGLALAALGLRVGRDGRALDVPVAGSSRPSTGLGDEPGPEPGERP